MQKLSDKLKDIPKKPGVYQFLDAKGGVIYVGKAKNLRSRVGQYFQKHDNRPQLPYLMAEAVDVNYTVVGNELESAFLENTLIKQYTPKYNIDLKDDKNYAFITIDYSFQIPQIAYIRKFDPKNKQIKYFGPYSAAHKIKNTLNLVRRIFPYCAAQKVGSRPCFYYYMHRCPGVCVGKITVDEYKGTLEKITKFLQGNVAEVVADIKKEMGATAHAKKFETAARLRDQLRALEILEEKQNVILPKKVDWDLVSLASSDGYAAINLFKIRSGKLFDKENFVYELKYGDIKVYEKEIMQRFLEQYYLETSSAPKAIYTQIAAQDAELVKRIIQSRFKRKTEITIPQKGKIKKLVDLGALNAEEYLKNWLQDKAGSLDKINKALAQLKEILKLEFIPKRIECYDISNTQGSNPVGSMVVFVDGLPAKSQYRKFKIQGKKTPDDFAMLREMLKRRMERLAANDPKWAKPDLIVIDGGKGQLSAALEVLSPESLALIPIPVIGLAKRIEEIFVPGKKDAILVSQDQPALQLLQRLRDEAHRFGITFHRKLRSKQAIKSALDDIPGIGPKTKKLLKAKFGTVANIKKTSLEKLTEVVGQRIAQLIQKSL